MMNNRSSLDTGLFYAGLSLPRGAGGARMWFDEVPEQRVSHFRKRCGRSATLATACPFLFEHDD